MLQKCKQPKNFEDNFVKDYINRVVHLKHAQPSDLPLAGVVAVLNVIVLS